MNNWSFQNLKAQDKIAILLLIGMVLFLFSIVVINNKNNHIRTDEIKIKQKVAENPFEKITLGAKAAIVWDMNQKKVIFSQNSDAVLPLASLTKAMVALTATELAPDYTTVTIKKDFLQEEGDTGLLVDERWRLRDLLNMSLISSSNDGVRAIATVIGSEVNLSKDITDSQAISTRDKFVAEMNKKAEAIGLTGMHFENESGLDIDPNVSGAYGSAQDIALLFDYIVRNHNSLLEPTRYPELTVTSLNNISHTVDNTDIVVNSIPGLLASKTGLTDLAGGNLAVVTDLGLEGPYVIAVLGSTQDGRFADMQTLIRATEDYVTKVK